MIQILCILLEVGEVDINYGYHGNNTQNPHKVNIANWTFKLKKKSATELVIYLRYLLIYMISFLLRFHMYYIRVYSCLWNMMKVFPQKEDSPAVSISDTCLSLSHLSPETRIEEKFTWPLRIMWSVTHKKNSQAISYFIFHGSYKILQQNKITENL